MTTQKRSRNYSDSYVQGALLRRVLTHWFIFFLATGIAVTAIPALAGDPAMSFAERVGSQMNQLGSVALIMLVLLPAFVVDTVKFSNRFVGPIARLRKSIRTLGETGTAKPIKFRESDFWTDSATEFNTVLKLVDELRNAADQKAENQDTVETEVSV